MIDFHSSLLLKQWFIGLCCHPETSFFSLPCSVLSAVLAEMCVSEAEDEIRQQPEGTAKVALPHQDQDGPLLQEGQGALGSSAALVSPAGECQQSQ